MILGMAILKHTYSVIKYISVIAITIGLIMVTMESSAQTPSLTNATSVPQSNIDNNQSNVDYSIKGSFRLMIGVSLLIFSLFASALTGVYQEQLFKNYGKHPKEAQFYMVIVIFLI